LQKEKSFFISKKHLFFVYLQNMKVANIPDMAYDFPQTCKDGTSEYGDCKEHGGFLYDVSSGTPSIKTQIQSKFDVSKLTDNERVGLFIGATLVVLYLINKN